MQIKKTAIITVLISTIFVSANFMIAKAYEPLVRLPGLPPTGPVTLSQYTIGLYNFLLSIVGIVAVMMLIIGGIKYITAAGNASVIGDAKDTISNALFGLLLALLSWVIVSTINPDVLYIKNPGSNFTDLYTDNLSACGYYNSIAIAPAPNCICKEEAVTFNATGQEDCENKCADSCGLLSPSPCVGGGLNEPVEKDGAMSCHCVDGNEKVELSAAAITADAKCNEVCSDPDLAEDGEYHGINWNLRAGTNTETVGLFSDKLTVPADVDVFYDFSGVKDCKEGTIYIAVDFDGAPLIFLPDTYCCFMMNPGCPINTWGQICDMIGDGRMCHNGEDPLLSGENHLPTISDSSERYPVIKHNYSSAGSFEELWVGVSFYDGGLCSITSHLFQINVQ